jgi:hypothetical protein
MSSRSHAVTGPLSENIGLNPSYSSSSSGESVGDAFDNDDRKQPPLSVGLLVEPDMVLLDLDRSTGDDDGGAWSQAEVVGGGEGLRRSALVPEVRRGDIAGGSGGEVAPKAWGAEETALARG